MNEVDVVTLLRDAMLVTAKLSAPVLIIGMIVGLIISVIQTTTSIQEQTLTFVPKLIAIGLAILIFLPWMLQVITEYTINIFEQIGGL